jgi:hypothetical protein
MLEEGSEHENKKSAKEGDKAEEDRSIWLRKISRRKGELGGVRSL